MAINMDAVVRLRANVQGANAIQAFNRNLKGLEGASKLTSTQLGHMNIAINRMAREAGNTTAGLRQHLAALQQLRDRVEIGSKAYRRLGGEIDALRGKLRGLDGDAQKTGTTLKDQLVGGLATLGVGQLAGGIVRTAATFDQEVRKAAAIEGSGAYDELRRSIEGVASAAAGTPIEVAALATALSRAGFSARETSQALAGIVMGAEAAAVSFEEMGSIAADSMRAFGIDTAKTQQVVDILVKSANSSNQTVLDLGESMKYAAPISRSLGVNINDLAATMAILANNGIRGSEAGTALRTGLQRLQIAASGNADSLLDITRGSKLLGKAMKILGADVLEANGQLKPMDQVLLSLKKNLATMPVGVQTEVIKALFGDEAGGKLRAALNSTDADIRKMFDTIRNSGGAALQTRKEMQGFQNALDRLGGNIQTVTNQIGDAFAVLLFPLAEGLNQTLGLLSQMPTPLKQIAAAAAAAGIAAAGLALAIKTLGGISALTGITLSLSGAMQGLTAGISAATVAAKGFAAALLANPIGATVAGLVLLTAAAYNFNKPFQEFVNTIPQRIGVFWQSLFNDASFALNRTRQLWTDFGNWVVSLWQGLKNSTSQALAAIGIDAGQLAAALQNIALAIGNAWNSVFRGIAISWQRTVANMINNTNPLFFVLKRLGVADVGGAASKALFGELPSNQAPAVPRSNIIQAAPLAVGTGAGLDAGGAAAGAKAAADKAAAEAKRRAEEAKRAAEQMRQQVKAADDLNFSLKNQLAILEETDAARRMQIEYDVKINEIAKKYNELREQAKSQEEVELLRANRTIEARIAQIEYEREINELMEERARLMIEITRAAAMPTVFNELEHQSEALDKMLGQYPAIGAAADAAANLATSGVSQMIAGTKTAQQVFADFLGSIADALIDTARQMIAQYIAIGVARMFAGVGGPPGMNFTPVSSLPSAGLTNALPTNFAFANGGIMTADGPVPLRAYANGGIARSPQLALYGEGSRPEAYVPLPDGRRIPVALQGATGTSQQVVNNVSVSVDAKGTSVEGNNQSASSLGRVVAAAVQQELIRQRRPDGLLARA